MHEITKNVYMHAQILVAINLLIFNSSNHLEIYGVARHLEWQNDNIRVVDSSIIGFLHAASLSDL